MNEAPHEPPGARKVVVLRQGPPKHTSLFIDGVAGIVGIGLLVMAGVLGTTLPVPDIIPIEYLPEFNTTSQPVGVTYDGEFFAGSVRFVGGEGNQPTTVEGTNYVFEFEVAHDNVFQVRVEASTPGDDVPGSAPDSWRFTLFDNNGDLQSEPKTLRTAASVLRDPDPTDPSNVEMAIPRPSSINEAWRFRAAPEQEYIRGGPDLTREEAQLIASEAYTVLTKGTWRFEMKAQPAGDCPPSPGADPDSARFFAACMNASHDDQGADFGNPLTIVGVSYDYYNIEIMA